MHCGNRNKHFPTTVTCCLFTNINTNFETLTNMPSLKEQLHEINWMFASLLDNLYDIMDDLSYIKWKLANRWNSTVNNNLIFDLFRTIGRFWNSLSTYCFSFHFILMSLQLSPLELPRLVVMPGVTDEMAQIFQNQPLFILGLCYFTYTSQHINRLQRETKQVRHEQAFLFNRIVEDEFEQKIRPLVIRHHRQFIHCQNQPYATTLSSNSDNSKEPPSAPSLWAIDKIVHQTIPHCWNQVVFPLEKPIFRQVLWFPNSFSHRNTKNLSSTLSVSLIKS